jgi:uncharacterized peroxidase-related enzyme
MSWTRRESADTLAEPLRSLFEQIRGRARGGRVSHYWQSVAVDPPAVEALLALHRALMDDPAPLTRSQAELIAVVVSATNGCGYCVAHHGPRLAEALANEALAHAVAKDYREANLAARDRVLLDFAVALTCEPSERKRDDVERVREYGFDDDAIVKATAIAGYYNLVNRIVSALGIALEPEVEPWEFGAQR